MIRIISAILILLGASSCTDGGEHIKDQPVYDESSLENQCFVLCDFSASQDSVSRQEIEQNAEAISDLASGYLVRFYDISAAAYEKPFATRQPMTTPEISNELDNQKRLEDFNKTNSKVKTSIKSQMLRPSSYNTCIIRTIDKVVNTLANDPKNKMRNIRVFILSDMLEDCRYSFGSIDIDHGRYKEALKVLEHMPKADFSLAGYRNLDISIVAASRRKINPAEQRKFWIMLFKKYDFNFESPILVDLPAWLTARSDRAEQQ